MSDSADCITNGESGAVAARHPLPPAPVWRRLTAAFYDSILLAAICFIVTAIVVAARHSGVPAGSGWFRLLLAGTAWLYFAWCWVHGGETVGMRAWKLRVVAAAPAAAGVSWSQATLRFATAFVPALPLTITITGIGATVPALLALASYSTGFALSLLRRDRACWHDLASRTRLVHVT